MKTGLLPSILIAVLCFVSAASASKKEDHEIKEKQARLESLKADVEAAAILWKTRLPAGMGSSKSW